VGRFALKVLFEILHPGQVHAFRHLIRALEARGDEVIVTARVKDVALDLLRAYGIPHRVLSRLPGHRVLLLVELVNRVARLSWICLHSRPDVLVGAMGPTIAVTGRLLGIPSVVYYCNESARAVNWLTQRLATRYLVPPSYRACIIPRVHRIRSYSEWAYTAPGSFTPDPDTWTLLGLAPGTRYFVVRLVSWQSIHDIGARGIGDPERLAEALRHHGRVFVSSERPLPPVLAEYRLAVPPAKVLDVLAHAALYVGESATMATEASLLGTPAVYVSDSFRGVTAELEERYGLAFNFTTLEAALPTVIRLAADPASKHEWATRRQRFAAAIEDFNAILLEEIDSVVAGAGGSHRPRDAPARARG